LDSLPPPASNADSPPAAYATAPGDIYPRSGREAELCASASHADYLYLGGLVALDAGAWVLDWDPSLQSSTTDVARYVGPTAFGLTWGATLGGAWLALPKCDPHWVGEAPREGDVKDALPTALSIGLLAGATAPVIQGILIGNGSSTLSTTERAMHLVTAGAAGFVGAFLPYLLPPRTWSAAREIERIRVGTGEHGGVTLGYALTF
jgi:hypothetical protein